MSFSISGPIAYTLKRNWYVYTNATMTTVAGFLKKESLRAWWRLNTDVSATGAEGQDSSGYGHSLTAPTDADRPAFDTGDSPSEKIQASSCLFDADDVLEAADSSSLSFGNGTTDSPFSISCWVKFTSLTNNQILVGKSNSGNNEWYLFKNSGDGVLKMYLMDNDSAGAAGRASVDSTDTVVAGQWHHVVMTYAGNAGATADSTNPNGLRIYIDSVDRSSSYATGADYNAMYDVTANVGIGNLDTEVSNYGLNGNLADLAIWATELSPTDVSALYNAKSYTTFSNYRNWTNKKSIATPGTRVSATYQGVNIESSVSASADAFALGVLPWTHVQHNPTKFFRGSDQLFVTNFDDTVRVPEGINFPQSRAASITVVKAKAEFVSASMLGNSPGSIPLEGVYEIPNNPSVLGRATGYFVFIPDPLSTSPSRQGPTTWKYGTQGIKENDLPEAAQRLYDAIYSASAVPNDAGPLNVNVSNPQRKSSTIYLTLKGANASGTEQFDGRTIMGSAVNGLGGASDVERVAYATKFPAFLSDNASLSHDTTDQTIKIEDQRDFMSMFDQPKYSFPLDLESPKWAFGLGQSSQYDDIGAFHDGGGFDPIFYLTYSGSSAMWPVNLTNAGLFEGRLFDGVLECFDLRREITFDLDLRYDGRTIRGQVTGPYSSNFMGSTAIVSHETTTNDHHTPFLDAADPFIHDKTVPLNSIGSITITSATFPDEPLVNSTFMITDGSGFTVQFVANPNSRSWGIDPRQDQSQMIREDRSRSWRYTYGTQGAATVNEVCLRLFEAIRQASNSGDLRTEVSVSVPVINLIQKDRGKQGNTRIKGTAITGDNAIAETTSFSGGVSSIDTITATSSPLNYYWNLYEYFPLDEDGNPLPSPLIRAGGGADFLQEMKWWKQTNKTTLSVLPSKDLGVQYLLLQNSKLPPFIDRIYVHQFVQSVFLHNEDNSGVLDPIISSITNLSSSVYPSSYDSTVRKWSQPGSPFKHGVYHGPRKGEITNDLPQTWGATGFYYSKKPDSIAFGDL